MVDRRTILKGLGWLAGAACAAPRNIFACTMPIEQLQAALGVLGYLPIRPATGIPDDDTERALIRFKKHARRTYRMSRITKKVDDVDPANCFCGEPDAMITEETVWEVKRWVERGWQLPLGRFKFASLATPGKVVSSALRYSMLREDTAVAWRSAMENAATLGATLAEPYGDTLRGLGFARKDGTSRTSLHICGRAVDLNQGLGQGINQRYFLSREDKDDEVHFRIYCRTQRQDGSQGTWHDGDEISCWRAGVRNEWYLPQGWYVDLTELLAAYGFERVKAHEGWERFDIRSEWWHYYHAVDLQETFLDECELVGISEKRLRSAGYSLEELDGEPG